MRIKTTQTGNLSPMASLLIPTAMLIMLAPLSCGKSDKGGSTDGGQGSQTGVSGSASSGNGTVQTSPHDVPSDSSGTTGVAALQFSTALPGAMALTAATSLDIGNGITLSDARLNIAVIKVKANKDRSSEERTRVRQEHAAIRAAEADNEAAEKAIEKEKQDLDSAYEKKKQGATNDTQRAQAKADLEAAKAALEASKAALHAAKEAADDEREAAADGNIRWKGPYVYDLIAKTMTPDLASVVLPDGSYRRIEFKLRQNRTAPAGDGLLNQSVYIAGNVSINGTPTPFTVAIGSAEQVLLTSNDGFKVEAGVKNAMIVAFDPSQWFSGLDFTQASKNADGVIKIAAGSNTPMLEAIKNNIKSKTEFSKDSNGDGKVESDEVKGDGKQGAVVEAADEGA